MALYRGSTKLSGIGQSFNPENTGTEGQVLTKTNNGYAYCDPQGGDDGPKVDVLVVGGGGNGGFGQTGGGGGGGGLKECKGYLLNSNSITVCVGAGGSKAYEQNNGGDSCFGDLVSLGGGAGGSSNFNVGQGCAGGNGGGAQGQVNMNCGRLGGVGMRGGYQGGNAGVGSGGGGGGAGGPGQSGTKNMCCSCCNTGGKGGLGYNSGMFCPNCFFSTGGNGAGLYTYVWTGAFPGGGDFCQDGTFYGGGGGGGFYCVNNQNFYCGGAGCQGVVMVRYPTDGSYGITSSTGGDRCFTCNGYCYVEFTTVGTSTFCITG